jgi:hypothetical protein
LLAALLAMSAAVVLVACGGGHAGCTDGTGAPAVVLDASRRAAMRLGDSAPETGKYVRTTRDRAAGLVGGPVNAAATPVYLVVLAGDFDGRSHRAGRLADFTVERRSGKLLDLGTSNLLPELSPLGQVSRFRPARCRR